MSLALAPQNIVVPGHGAPMPAVLFVPAAATATANALAGSVPTNNDAAATSDNDGGQAATDNGAHVQGESPARHPALLVLHDIYGLDDATREAAARLCELGYVTLAPDLFAASASPAEAAPEAASQGASEAALRDFATSLFDTRVVADALAALDALAAREDVSSTQLGIVGWGWGGAYALMTAAHNPRLRVAADIGGAISYPVLTPLNPGSPLNFVANLQGALFAAFPGGDRLFPEIEVERLAGRLVEHDKRGEVKIYPDAPPRFWRDASQPSTAALWRRLENFLRDQLADPVPADEYSASDEYSDDNPDAGYQNEESRLHA